MLSTWKNRPVDLDEPTLADEFYAELKKKIDGSGVKKTGGSDEIADLSGTYNN
jgi:hypothetical protein